MQRIAAFISPHGYGHATRTIAVLEALSNRQPDLKIRIFTSISAALFAQSLTGFDLHPVVTDIGLVQHDALRCDMAATIARLDDWLPFAQSLVNELAAGVRDCDCVLCDISPLGIAVAEAAGIPSVLVENFTWDWIYRPLAAAHPGLDRHVRTLGRIFDRADYHIQTEPVCNRQSAADLLCAPIFRTTKTDAETVKKSLGVGARKLVMVSLGGNQHAMPQWSNLADHPDLFFLLAGQPQTRVLAENCLALSRKAPYYHPDLIGAAELVVCKSGYSTVAECLQGGTRILCIDRPDFAESAVLSSFVRLRLEGAILSEEQFHNGTWLAGLPELLRLPGPKPARENGATAVATFLERIA